MLHASDLSCQTNNAAERSHEPADRATAAPCCVCTVVMALALRCALRACGAPTLVVAVASRAALRAGCVSLLRRCSTLAAAPPAHAPHASQQHGGAGSGGGEYDLALPPHKQSRVFFPHETLCVALQLSAAGTPLPATLDGCKRTVQLLAHHAALLARPLPARVEKAAVLLQRQRQADDDDAADARQRVLRLLGALESTSSAVLYGKRSVNGLALQHCARRVSSVVAFASLVPQTEWVRQPEAWQPPARARCARGRISLSCVSCAELSARALLCGRLLLQRGGAAALVLRSRVRCILPAARHPVRRIRRMEQRRRGRRHRGATRVRSRVHACGARRQPQVRK
jgi:hypothetical protein